MTEGICEGMIDSGVYRLRVSPDILVPRFVPSPGFLVPSFVPSSGFLVPTITRNLKKNSLFWVKMIFFFKFPYGLGGHQTCPSHILKVCRG